MADRDTAGDPRPRLASTFSSADSSIPLVVDVDGCLVRTDLLWEGMLQVAARNPRRLVGIPHALLRGKAALKAYLAQHGRPALDTLPLNQSVVSLIDDAHGHDRQVILASGADCSQLAAIGELVDVVDVCGSDGRTNSVGHTKLARLRELGTTFDYVGNAGADLPIWREARRAYVVAASRLTLWRARRTRPDIIVLPSRRATTRSAFRAIRPHQWAKNTLLLLPALAAHLPWSWQLFGKLAAGVLSFSLVASAVYILNDLIDLPNDRQHPRKRSRPIAAGELGFPAAIALLSICAGSGIVLARQLPIAFFATLLLYAALTLLYSFLLKNRVVIDVMTLAALYTTRIIAGATLVDVPLSRWFLAFSVLFFLSLALVKRVVELQVASEPGGSSMLPGRGYITGDLTTLRPLGIAAEIGSALVYCLYITSDDIMRLYSRPDLLWLGLPILLYWHTRVWLRTGRGQMQDDPVVFALRDHTSRVVLAVFLIIVLIASH